MTATTRGSDPAPSGGTTPSTSGRLNVLPRPNVLPYPVSAPVAGGLLIAPKSTEATPGAASTAPAPAGGSSAAPAPGDLSPRAQAGGDGQDGDVVRPSPEAAQLALPEELALGDLFPPAAPADGTGATADAAAPTGSAPAGDALGDYGHDRSSRWPLIAGMVVTLAILAFGGGFVWWRDRDRYYWPA